VNNKEYIENVLETESMCVEDICGRLCYPGNIRLIHAAMGMCTESTEFLDALKKFVFYGKKINETNLIEEIGDCLWYIAVALDELGVDFEHVQEANIRKLRARYPNKFNKRDAINRDLAKEEKAIVGDCDD
jgi:NTP pyrophosphatase (non-canonical NTP hydrolase)